MKKILLLYALIPCALAAQTNPYVFPGTSAASDSLSVAASVEEDGNEQDEVEFTRGRGSVIDTLEIGDGRLRVVLKDDNTWFYVKNMDVVAADEVFASHWSENVINSYSDVQLSSLPLRNTICLIDSVSRWTCPYQTKVFSKFGYRHGRRHQGVDLPLKKGDPVKAAFDGRVRTTMFTSGYGNLVIIRHENGLETYYGHLSKVNVHPGDWVSSGDVIGLGGSTGRATGPHLHFETRYQGFAFDPQWIADFETGELHASVFVLKRSYLDPSSHYVPQSLDEEDDVYGADEAIVAEEERIAAEQAAMRWHIVKSGETVSAIASKEHVSLDKIKKLNPGLNINKIRIGQKIRVN